MPSRESGHHRLKKHAVVSFAVVGISFALIYYLIVVFPERFYKIPGVGPDLIIRYYQAITGLVVGLASSILGVIGSMVREYFENKLEGQLARPPGAGTMGAGTSSPGPLEPPQQPQNQ